MRKTSIKFFVLFGVLILSLSLFVKDGKIVVFNPINETNNKIENINITFSHESGFYDETIYLEIKSEDNTEIYYTLDSSEPTNNSIKYTGPIKLDCATEKENVYSMNTDTSTAFYTDLIEKYKSSMGEQGYVAPDYKVDKCNVVRVVVYDEDGNRSDIITKSYFIGIDKTKYSDTNVMSIVTDPDNLFGEEKGIYVTGNSFKEALEKGYVGNEGIYNSNDWRRWSANYLEVGKDWEREVSIDFFDESFKFVNNQNAGIRIQGNMSKAFLPRSLNIYAREEYGSNYFNNVFDKIKSTQKITLAAGGNILNTKFNDYFVSEVLNNEINASTMEYQPYVLFIDGEYWGFYWLASSYCEGYFSQKYNVNESNILMIKNGDVEIGDESYSVLYSRMLDTIKNLDMSIDENYEKACEIIDIDSFVDYYSFMIYIARTVDWPNSNIALWRTINNDKNSKYGDCKWRWIIFDCNSASMSTSLIEHDTLNETLEKDKLLSSLWKNESFRQKFKNRILEIADTNLSVNNVESIANTYFDKYHNLLKESWTRFRGSNNDIDNSYFLSRDNYISFFRERKKIVESWFD